MLKSLNRKSLQIIRKLPNFSFVRVIKLSQIRERKSHKSGLIWGLRFVPCEALNLLKPAIDLLGLHATIN